MLFPSLQRRMPPRMPAGIPANFKGVPDNKEQLAKIIQEQHGGEPFSPVGNGVGSMRTDVLSRIKRAVKGFFGVDAFEVQGRNKFMLRGMANFTGDYPKDLVAARQNVSARTVR